MAARKQKTIPGRGCATEGFAGGRVWYRANSSYDHGMARSKAADYEQRRETILDRAAELFAGKGFNGASVADLAKACDTSKSLIYHYYPSKEDILYGVMASHIEALVTVVGTLADEASDPRDRLRRLIGTFISLYAGAAARQKVLLDELDSLPPHRRTQIVTKQRSIVAAVSALLVEIQPALQNDRHRLNATTMLLFGMINWTKNWFHPNGPISPAQLADLATDMVLNGAFGSADGKVRGSASGTIPAAKGAAGTLAPSPLDPVKD